MISAISPIFRSSMPFMLIIIPVVIISAPLALWVMRADDFTQRYDLRAAVQETMSDARVCMVENDGYFSDFAFLKSEYCGLDKN